MHFVLKNEGKKAGSQTFATCDAGFDKLFLGACSGYSANDLDPRNEG